MSSAPPSDNGDPTEEARSGEVDAENEATRADEATRAHVGAEGERADDQRDHTDDEGDRPRAAGEPNPDDWLPDRIEAYDRDLYRWFATRRHGPLDQALPKLSNAANYSRLWLGIAAGMYLVGGGRAKATALRAVAAIGITSAVANLAVKRLPRARPPQEEIPDERKVRLPTSSSFPSGHSASAAAFATVVAQGEPALLPPVAVLAAGVMFSRVYTGVHYPTDVAAGAAIGMVVGSTICAVRPVR